MEEIGVVDLFAGPGGLGEGFSAAGREGAGRMSIRLSVECDPPAVETLRLRSFLRSFDDGFPQAYYDALNDGRALPDWSETHPAHWQRALHEVRSLRLGDPGSFEAIAPDLDAAREKLHGSTILIGGPPCQAYSVVGRSRNRATPGYVPEKDSRHYLYREYVAILNRLQPAAFVMENVKGLLTSMVGGGRIVEQVIEDLEEAGDEGYRLVPLVGERSDLLQPVASDFLVEAEFHGIPQTRHRLFVVGIRNDVASSLKDWSPVLGRAHGAVPVSAVISDLEALRSGLSQNDGADEWRFQVRRLARLIRDDPATPSDVALRFEQLLVDDLGALSARVGRRLGSPDPHLPQGLASWLHDPRLEVVTHHETRSHMVADLGRYAYVAVLGHLRQRSPRLSDLPPLLQPAHANRGREIFKDRFRVQLASQPSGTITSHIAKDGHYFIHPDPMQCRAFTVREAARIQTFPDNYVFRGNRTEQYRQVGNAVPPYLALQIARGIRDLLAQAGRAASATQMPMAVGFS